MLTTEQRKRLDNEREYLSRLKAKYPHRLRPGDEYSLAVADHLAAVEQENERLNVIVKAARRHVNARRAYLNETKSVRNIASFEKLWADIVTASDALGEAFDHYDAALDSPAAPESAK